MPITAGWREFADFPTWKLHRVRVKLDTGARSAAIGVHQFQVISSPGGAEEVVMYLAPYRKRPDKVIVVREPVVGFKRVKSSTGVVESRPVIEVEVRLGRILKRIRATVADRSRMLVPVLLGRTALAPDFVVDPNQKYLLKGGGSPQRHKGHAKGHQG